jgi:acid phosphatase
MIGHGERYLGRKPRGVTIAVIAAIACVWLSAFSPAPARAQAGCNPPPKPEPLQTPLNLTLVKRQLIYYRCTRYDADLARVLHEARAFVERRAGRVARPALVLDIDETSLSNWEKILHNDFGFIAEGDCDLNSKRACGQGDWDRSARAVAIVPTVDLFNAAKAHHVAVFFITGRRDVWGERDATEFNLHKVGYEGWNGLYLRPQESNEHSVTPYKTWARSDIEAHGYTIIANVGDQWSDLANGHAERRFKLPNPFYFLP